MIKDKKEETDMKFYQIDEKIGLVKSQNKLFRYSKRLDRGMMI